VAEGTSSPRTGQQGGTGELLWSADAAALERTNISKFVAWLKENRGLVFDDYGSLWQWSVDELPDFWSAIYDYFEVISHATPEAVLRSREMPGAEWFPGARLNYAEHCLARGDDEEVVILARSQTRPSSELTRGELRDAVARARAGLLRLGVEPGDRVAAYLPNIPEAVVAMLATTSIGAVWVACAPEFGTDSVLDRLGQVEPKVLLVVDGYRYGPKAVDRLEAIAEIRSNLPSVESTVQIPYLHPDEERVPDALSWGELCAEEAPLAFLAVPFDHPLWILFSSGTTGLPKPIVQGHGGIVLEHLKGLVLHHDLGAGDRFFFFATTGWMVWNVVVSSLLVGASFVVVDGDPAQPDLLALWRLAQDARITHLGLSASYIGLCRQHRLEPGTELDLSAVRYLVAAGSPLPADGFRWLQKQVGEEVFVTSGSGGTDICSGLVGTVPVLPVYAGEMAGRWLGAKVEAWDPEGNPVVDELGELVILEPLPSMPVKFWNDTDGERYRKAYFEMYPGVWRHGDWLMLTSRETCVISGRSDATLNRGGVRLGTSEFYAVVEDLPGIEEALVVHLEDTGQMGELLLFVVLRDGVELDDELRRSIGATLRSRLSPRHTPDRIEAVAAIPKNLTGKKLEVPVKRILLGADPREVVSTGSLVDPAALDDFIALAQRRIAAS
jgi:acetoacetyl-CoA synthetase